MFRVQAAGGPRVPAAAHAMALPLNYFLELGFFLCAAVLWWKKRRAGGKPLTRDESALGDHSHRGLDLYLPALLGNRQ